MADAVSDRLFRSTQQDQQPAAEPSDDDLAAYNRWQDERSGKSNNGDGYVHGRSSGPTFDEMDFSETRILVLPGGMPGTNNLQAFKPLEELVLAHAAAGKTVAAICAAPKILGALGMLKGRRACCHPGFEKELIGADVIMNRPAVLDGNIITGRSMGCAIPFGLTVLGALEGAEAAAEMAEKIVWMPIEYNDIG